MPWYFCCSYRGLCAHAVTIPESNPGLMSRKKRTDTSPPITESPITMSFPGGNWRARELAGTGTRKRQPKLHILLARQANSDRFACVERCKARPGLGRKQRPLSADSRRRCDAPPFFSLSVFFSVVVRQRATRKWQGRREAFYLKRKIINITAFGSPLGNLRTDIRTGSTRFFDELVFIGRFQKISQT